MRNLHPQPTAGSLLLMVMIFTAMLSILVCSTLVLVSSKTTLTARSVDWNNAMPLAEAGIEEALTQLQVMQSTNFSTNGWTYSNGTYYKTRTNLVNYGYYTVGIQPTNYQVGYGPTIIATGYVAVPFGNINFSDTTFTSVSGGSGTNSFIHRTVTVVTTLLGGFPYAVLVKDKVSGSNYVDSFNSQDPNYSSNGLYTASKREANATVASLTTIGDFSVNNGDIYGSVALGAASGNPSISGGSVGDLAFVANTADAGKFETGHVINNFSTAILDVTAPFTSSGNLITLGTYPYGGTNYTFYAGTGNYSRTGNIGITAGRSMVIAGKAVIYVSGKFTVSGSGYMYIAPGASLTMYVGGPSCTISGGGIINGTGNATNCAINCLPGCTTVTNSGSGNYVGTFNAPQATVTLSGSADMSGALVANNVVFSGGRNLHYDESLGTGGKPKYAVSSWRELP